MSVESLIRAQFAALIGTDDYPCLGARSLSRRGGYGLHVYGALPDESGALASDLAAFSAAPREGLSSFAACFTDARPRGPWSFERDLWRQLSLLRQRDSEPWADGYSDDPTHPDFAFSFAGRAYFVVGLHGCAPRYSRRLGWPTILFNPHDQFQRLRAAGHFEKMRDQIRAREELLQPGGGFVSDHGLRSEAPQYGGCQRTGTWVCPVPWESRSS